jgi:hypothetical protein
MAFVRSHEVVMIVSFVIINTCPRKAGVSIQVNLYACEPVSFVFALRVEGAEKMTYVFDFEPGSSWLLPP